MQAAALRPSSLLGRPSTARSCGCTRLMPRAVRPLAACPRVVRTSVIVRASSTFANARAAIEQSTPLVAEGKVEEALAGFQAALEMSPNDDEARAAHYNSACCYTKLEEWNKACDSVIAAINDYDLRLIVALKDDDLERLRERPEFDRVLSEVKGGLSDSQYIKVRQEAKSPFMLVRTILFGGLAAGAGLGLLVISGRLAAAVKGGEGAPDMMETVQNFGINSGVLAVLVFLLVRDAKKQQREITTIEREEKLAKLMVQVNDGRSVVLQTFRGIARPLVIAGTRGHVTKVMTSAEPYRNAIKDRGIELVPVILDMEDPSDKIAALKKELAAERKVNKGFSKASKEGTASAPDMGDSSPKRGRKKYNVKVGKKKLVPVDVPAWEEWLQVVKDVAGIKEANLWVQVQLDGSVRSSGIGMPNWDQLMSDIPSMDSVRSKMMQ